MSLRNHALFLAGAALLAFAAPAQADGILEEPLPRFEDRLCPGIVGLERDFAMQMVGRIRANAERIGLTLADDQRCEANFVVAFVDDGQAYLADLVDRRGYLFRDLGLADRDDLLGVTGPVRVWHQVSARTRDGIRVGLRENLTSLPQAGMWSAHSRIYRPVRNDITYSLVLFDRDEVRGLTLAQLADYASLRGLSTRFPEEAGTSAHSLLTLFDDPDGRAGALTAFDAAWLERLYSGIATIPASVRLRGVTIADSGE